MSAPVQTSLASLKAATTQLVDIIARAWHILAGTGEAHLALTAKATTLVAAIIWDFQNRPYMPGIVASCFKELLRVRSMTPQVLAWEALGNNSCDLPVMPNPSTGPLTVDLPSPPIVLSPLVLHSPPGLPAPCITASPVAGPSTTMTSKFWNKGKGKAIDDSLGSEVGGSRKRKSPLISGQSSEPPKSTMKSHKWVKSTPIIKLSLVVESEDDDDTIIKLISSGVLEVVLPWSSTIAVRTSQSPHSPSSPKKQSFSPASLTASSRPGVPATSDSHPEDIQPSKAKSGTSAGDPPALPTFNIMVPSPNNPCHYCFKEEWPCQGRLDTRTGTLCLSYIHCSTKKLKCQPASMGSPPPHTHGGGKSTSRRTRSKTPAPKALSASQSRAQTQSQSRGPSRPPATPALATQVVQSCGCRKTNNDKEAATPAPAPALAPAPLAIASSSSRVPPAALDIPMPDLHSMAIMIWNSAARIALLEAHVREQDTKIDTLQRLHESLQRKVVDWHPSFPLLDSPAPATFLLDQSITPSMSLLPSALPNLINLDMDVIEPSTLKVEDGSDMVGLMFEPSPVQPEGPQTSGKIVDLDDPGNLVPEYNSVSEEMDVEVKDETSGGEVEMAT